MGRKIAAAYIRVSTEDQTEYSPDAQLRELRAYADANNIILDERYVFSDEGISGRSVEKRPGFQSMIRTAKRADHPFDLILVHKFDRFARSREDSVVFKSILSRCGVKVVSIKEPISEGSYSGVMEAIYESFAEAYSLNLSQEVKKGMTEKALRGELQTSPPFGYRAEQNKLIPNQNEALWVRWIFDRFAGGDSIRQIAAELNETGVRTKRGNPFENRAVAYILTNPVYIGMLRWNPECRSGRTIAAPERILVCSDHAPLIDPELWQHVQDRINAEKRTDVSRGKPSDCRKHRLSGILRCAACGATLIWTKPGYFRCSRYLRGTCRQSQHIKASIADLTVEKAIFQHRSTVPLPCYRLRKADDQHIDPYEQRLNQIRLQLLRAAEGYAAGILDAEQALLIRQQLTEQKNAIIEHLSAAKATGSARDAQSLKRVILQAYSGTCEDLIPISKQYDALNAVIDTLTFSKSDRLIRIVFRYHCSRPIPKKQDHPV